MCVRKVWEGQLCKNKKKCVKHLQKITLDSMNYSLHTDVEDCHHSLQEAEMSVLCPEKDKHFSRENNHTDTWP